MKQQLFIAVFGHGQGCEELDEHTKIRVETAVDCVMTAIKNDELCPTLVFMAGVGARSSRVTMAHSMEQYARFLLNDERVGSGEYITNTNDLHVWGTVLEMKWCFEKVKDACHDPKIFFVSNSRHLRRARFANEIAIGIPNCGFYESRDPAPNNFHELLGYLKIGVHALHFAAPFEVMRRKLYRGG